MRAAVLTAVDRPLELEDLQPPALGPHDVRVDLEASDVRHSDLTMCLSNVNTALDDLRQGTVLRGVLT